LVWLAWSLACGAGSGACVASAEVCGVTIRGPVESEGCNGPSWSLASGDIQCGDDGECSGVLSTFDMRAAGYDAVGALQATGSVDGEGGAVLNVRRTCEGEDCAQLAADLGAPSCSETVRFQPASCDTGDAGWRDTAGDTDR
jgi:hypothetical protein